MTDRSKLLSILVRAPIEGYRLQDVYKKIYKTTNKTSGWSKLRRALDGFDDLPIWQDDGMIGMLDRRKIYYPLPFEDIDVAE